MKPSTINLDLTNVQEESASMFSKVPAGDYEVSLAHSQFKDGKNPGAAGLQVGYMIESGPHKGKMLQDYINIMNSNEQAVDIGKKRLKTILVLQQRKTFILKTDAELVSRNKFMVSVAIEPNTYTNRNGDVIESENCAVKKLFAVEGNADIAPIKEAQAKVTAAKKAAPVVEAHVEEESEETPPWMKS
jgi:hypothetical protein